MGEIGIADERTDANAAVNKPLYAIETGQPRHIDDDVGAAHAALHEIQEVSAGGEVDRARPACGRDGVWLQATSRQSSIMRTSASAD
jgi:hypothetical protein